MKSDKTVRLKMATTHVKRLMEATLTYEYGLITLRTPEGWLLWSQAQPGPDTLGEMLKQARQNLKRHEANKAI